MPGRVRATNEDGGCELATAEHVRSPHPCGGFCTKFSGARGEECTEERAITVLPAGQSMCGFDSQRANFFCRQKRGYRSRRRSPGRLRATRRGRDGGFFVVRRDWQ